MLISLHKNARTTPAIRSEIANSTDSVSILAQRYSLSEASVYKWKKRDTFEDRSHTAHRLQTTLTPAQEAVVVHLRRTLLLPLDDLLAVTREFLCPGVSRSGLDRCLRRHHVRRPTNTALVDLPEDRRGTVSGLLSLSRNIGLITGASAMGTVFLFSVGTQELAHATASAIAAGMHLTFLLADGMAISAIVIAHAPSRA